MSQHKWTFKSRFRKDIFGWNGTQLASQRMKEAVDEIKKVAKTDPSLAAEGCLEFISRLYPACQCIDTSSGAFGNAAYHTIHALIPLLIAAQWDMNTRGRKMEQLYQAVCEDGWDLLAPVTEQWGKICVYPGLAHLWADRFYPQIYKSWKNQTRDYPHGAVMICLSCLLETGRYDKLKDLIATRHYSFWTYDRFWAEALVRQGKIDEAIAFAESLQDKKFETPAITHFCEKTLLEAGREEEAYKKYALKHQIQGTYLAAYREIIKKYSHKNKRQILLDLIEKTGKKGKWFAAVKSEGYLDIALECAKTGEADPNTLLRAAKDYAEKDPEFAIQVGIEGLMVLLTGEFREPITPQDVISYYSQVHHFAEKGNIVEKCKSEISQRVMKDQNIIKKGRKEVIFKILGL